MGSRHLHYTIESPFSQPPQPPPPPPPPKTNLPMLYYGLIVVGTAAIVLAMYNLIFIKWTSNGHNQQLASRSPNTLIDASRTRRRRSFENLDTFKYKKKEGSSVDKEQAEGVENYVECAVCLSIFEEGEDVRRLPTCKHSFHAACIDMWLYSHSDCPLCRAQVPVTWCQLQLTTTPEENSREVLLV